ncbi:hypothetical protein [Paenarthrobacter nicotinovorans]|uniref:hypothetical protein n=1 Tax=Paenarthrobacter nicotinovorans TaxID=29320 RepID=UPI000479A60D|nr:hypothetical protein [Paenarthrobacter nicotinovorans]
MKGTRVFPRATAILRSVMIAGAGTALWMTLSATGASADSGVVDNQSLLGGMSSSTASAVPSASHAAGSTVAKANKTVGASTPAAANAVGSAAKPVAPQATASTISIPIPDVQLPSPLKAVVASQPVPVPVPAVTPTVERVGGAVDEIVGAVPAVNRVVPGQTVGSVVDTALVPVTGTVDQAVSAVVPPVNEALETVALEPVTDITKPIVQPIIDVVDDVVDQGLSPAGSVISPTVPALPPLPGDTVTVPPAAPSGDAAPGEGVLPDSAVVGSPHVPAALESVVDERAAAGTEPAARISALGSASTLAPTQSISRTFGSAGQEHAVEVRSTQEPAAPVGLPAGPGAVPAALAGAGSGNSQNGPPSPAAAFLHGALIIPADSLAGLLEVSDEQHPKPVSFDPGSSPD